MGNMKLYLIQETFWQFYDIIAYKLYHHPPAHIVKLSFGLCRATRRTCVLFVPIPAPPPSPGETQWDVQPTYLLSLFFPFSFLFFKPCRGHARKHAGAKMLHTHTHLNAGKTGGDGTGSAGRAVGAWVRGCVADTTEDVRRHK